MGRDTRPESRTRFLDVPADPVVEGREEFFGNQLELIAGESNRKGRGLGAEILVAAAIAQRDEQPTNGSAIARTAHAWFLTEREFVRDEEWTSELVRSAATVAAFRSIPTSDFLLGVSAGLRGDTVAPSDASSTYRMGLRAVLDCERGRAGMTQLVVADTEPDHGADIDGATTRPHAAAEPVPPPLLTDPPRRPPPPQPPRPRAKPIASTASQEKEEDAPVPRGRRAVVTDEDLTRAHLIPKTEQLPQTRRK